MSMNKREESSLTYFVLTSNDLKTFEKMKIYFIAMNVMYIDWLKEELHSSGCFILEYMVTNWMI